MPASLSAAERRASPAPGRAIALQRDASEWFSGRVRVQAQVRRTDFALKNVHADLRLAIERHRPRDIRQGRDVVCPTDDQLYQRSMRFRECTEAEGYQPGEQG